MLERITIALEKNTLELFSIKNDHLTKKNALKVKILSDINAILTVRLNETEAR
ncbi:MAG: hypothetical protein FWC19_05470 [Treponema sp.]|nr:hypothetical protein [Treponema sp.]MCL2272236.1 hypothetical protein [Treponema sp.]